MSKIENNAINSLKMLSLEMIREAGSGDSALMLSSAPIFYALFMNYLNFDLKNNNFINRDRLIVSNKLLPLMYSSLYLFTNNLSLDNLKEFKKLNSKTPGYATKNTLGIEMGSVNSEDIISSAVGIALGERYLESLIKIENPKCNLIDFNTICICLEEDLMTGSAYEAMSYAGVQNLNRLSFIVIKDDISKDSITKDTFNEDLTDRFSSLNYDIDNVNGNNMSSILDGLDEIKYSKRPRVLIVKTTYGKDSSLEDTNENYNLPLSNNEIDELYQKYEITPNMYPSIKKEAISILLKRIAKYISKWNGIKAECIDDIKVKEIINFLENKEIKLNFKMDNIKIHDDYNEELTISNNKIFNVIASLSPFILCGSDDNFIYTRVSINKSNVMTYDNPTGRNILFGERTTSMGGIACGLASLGFKVFISTPLINLSKLLPSFKLSIKEKLPVHYIFVKDTFLNTYLDTGISAYDEVNILRNMPDLINFRPCDINEIIGIYDIISDYNKPTTIIIGDEKRRKLDGTNPKFVLAGAYRIKREEEDANMIILSSGTEVEVAIELQEELKPYGIDARVVSIPSIELFEMQSDKYKNMLIPKDIDTFVLEYTHSTYWYKYVSNDNYILGINKYSESGIKEELLNYYELSMDDLKSKIIEVIKNKE